VQFKVKIRKHGKKKNNKDETTQEKNTTQYVLDTILRNKHK